MLPKIHRLSLRTEFKKLKLEGRLVRGNFFSLLVRVRQDNQPSRFAFIVSKKVHLHSVKRNYVRRLMVEAVRNVLPKVELNLDGVFLVRQTILNQKLPEITKAVNQILNEKNHPQVN